jgi:hypothetical protein
MRIARRVTFAAAGDAFIAPSDAFAAKSFQNIWRASTLATLADALGASAPARSTYHPTRLP